MSKHRVAVLKVVSAQLSVTAAAAEYGISRGHLHRLLRRYRDGGLDDLAPRSRRPHTSPHGTSDRVRGRIVALRTEHTAGGLDAGPATIAWHLGREGLPAPSTSTIRRILHAAGLVVPEPRKRPRSSWIRFEAAAPNEVWQSDFTHWRLADGSEIEICSWLDDHSRYLLACTVFRRVGGDDVVATFIAAGDAHGSHLIRSCSTIVHRRHVVGPCHSARRGMTSRPLAVSGGSRRVPVAFRPGRGSRCAGRARRRGGR
jgi:transposase InsO family protein